MQSTLEARGRVLVLDRDRARSARRCGQLTAAGWQVLAVEDEAGALRHVSAGDVDLALLHVSADEAEAMDLPNVFRLASGVPHLPAVIIAPAPTERTRCRYLDNGADLVLTDDTSSAELAAHLRALHRVKLLQDELSASREALAASLARERSLLDQLRQDNAQLLNMASTDPLTHLHNIRYFQALLDRQFRIARRYDRALSVMMLDLDHFKLVNDTYGHPSGDYVLKEIAVILTGSVRDSDVVARAGGEEFSILLPNAGRAEARRFGQRIRRAIHERRFIVFGREIHVTVSIGLASYPDDAEITEPGMLVYCADQALLAAKQGGRDRLVRFADLSDRSRRHVDRDYRAERVEAAAGV